MGKSSSDSDILVLCQVDWALEQVESESWSRIKEVLKQFCNKWPLLTTPGTFSLQEPIDGDGKQLAKSTKPVVIAPSASAKMPHEDFEEDRLLKTPAKKRYIPLPETTKQVAVASAKVSHEDLDEDDRVS